MGFAVRPSHAVAALLKNRRVQLGLTLRDVEERSAALGDQIPLTLVARVEKGLVDPGFRRMSLLLRVYELPSQVANSLAELEQMGGQESIDPGAAHDEGIKAWRAGDLRKGLGHLLSLAKDSKGSDRLERQNALLGLAVAAASMSRYHLARHIVDQLLVEPPEPSLLFRVLLHAGACWNRLGSAEAALAFLDRAERYVEGDPKKRAWVCHNRALTLTTLQDFDGAARDLREALNSYRAASDPFNEGKARGALIHLNVQRGNLRTALDVAREAQEHAKAHGYERLWIMRRIDEGAILSTLKDTEAGITALQDALGRATSTQDDVCQFHAHYHLWKAFLVAGDAPRADLDLRAAQFHLRSLDENTPEAIEVRGTFGILAPDETTPQADEVQETLGAKGVVGALRPEARARSVGVTRRRRRRKKALRN